MSKKEHDELSDEEIENVTGAGISAQKAPGRRGTQGEPNEGGVEETNTTPGGGTTSGGISGSQTGNKGGLTP